MTGLAKSSSGCHSTHDCCVCTACAQSCYRGPKTVKLFICVFLRYLGQPKPFCQFDSPTGVCLRGLMIVAGRVPSDCITLNTCQGIPAADKHGRLKIDRGGPSYRGLLIIPGRYPWTKLHYQLATTHLSFRGLWHAGICYPMLLTKNNCAPALMTV